MKSSFRRRILKIIGFSYRYSVFQTKSNKKYEAINKNSGIAISKTRMILLKKYYIAFVWWNINNCSTDYAKSTSCSSTVMYMPSSSYVLSCLARIRNRGRNFSHHCFLAILCLRNNKKKKKNYWQLDEKIYSAQPFRFTPANGKVCKKLHITT